MQTISRRKFIGASALGLVALRYMPSCTPKTPATPFNWPLSFQSWGMRELLAKDFANTLKKIQALGYKGVEMCSPKSYNDFRPLEPLGPTGMRKIIEDAGLFCKTCHMSHGELRGDEVMNTIEYGRQLGLQDLVISSAALPEDAPLDEWKKVAEEMNKDGEIVKKEGMQMVYHNHTIGPELEGKQLYDWLMELLDPNVVKMQFQIASVSEGFDVVAYLAKYPGRYISLHMHDWDPDAKKIVSLGEGMVDWKNLLTTAKNSGLADYGMIIEMEVEPPADPFEALAKSYTYLTTLEL